MAPFNAVGVAIVAVANNGDGTYNVQFSDPVTIINSGTQEPSTLLNSPGALNWQGVFWTSQIDSVTVLATHFQGIADCNFLVILEQPVYLTAALPFQLAAPVAPIP